MPDHLGLLELQALLSGRLPTEEIATARRHLENCFECQGVLERTRQEAGTIQEHAPGARSAKSRPSSETFERGQTIGRYVVLDVLGVGGMGVVYAAFDPELDRKVAVKVLRPGSGSKEARARLLREAQAMAKVTHPNVVTVHDVGTHQGNVFVAMELIPGQTLRHWLREKPRALNEVLSAFEEAGKGLGHAHRAGLIHRDFKPDNVLVGQDGRVVVMDFGLARTAADPSRTPDPITEELSDVRAPAFLDQELTHAGSVMGTPAYMAPEQHRGEAVDARSDQFAFCVALFEAVYGKVPFRGGSFEETQARVLLGKPSIPADAKVPGWLRKVLLRGLSKKAAERFGSMDAVLAALRKGRRRRRRLLVLAVSWAATSSVSAAVAGQLLSQRPRACASTAQAMAQAWSAERKSGAQKGILSSGAPGASEAWNQVEATLDTHVGTWTSAQEKACAAAAQRGVLPDARLNRELGCLHEQAKELEALAGFLRSPDPLTVTTAARAARALPPPSTCLDTQQEVLEREAEELRLQLAEARVLARLSRNADAAAAAARIADKAKHKGYDAVLGDAQRWVGLSHLQGGNLGASDAAFVEALLAADRSGEARLGARAWADRAILAANWQGRPLAALEWAEHSEALAARFRRDPELLARIQSSRSSAYQALGRVEEALVAQEEAVTLATEAWGEEHFNLPRELNSLGQLQRLLGETEAAEKAHQKALVIQQAILPKGHPEFATTLNELALVRLDQNRLDESLTLHREALELQKLSYGKDHLDVVRTLAQLGRVLKRRGELVEAQETTLEARDMCARLVDAKHPVRLMLEQQLGDLAAEMREPRKALAHHQAALAGPSEVIPRRARARLLLSVAQDHLAVGERTKAAAPAEEALSLFTKEPDGGGDEATEARYALALALRAQGNRERSRALALEAVGAFERAGLVERAKAAQALASEKPRRR